MPAAHGAYFATKTNLSLRRNDTTVNLRTLNRRRVGAPEEEPPISVSVGPSDAQPYWKPRPVLAVGPTGTPVSEGHLFPLAVKPRLKPRELSHLKNNFR